MDLIKPQVIDDNRSVIWIAGILSVFFVGLFLLGLLFLEDINCKETTIVVDTSVALPNGFGDAVNLENEEVYFVQDSVTGKIYKTSSLSVYNRVHTNGTHRIYVGVESDTIKKVLD